MGDLCAGWCRRVKVLTDAPVHFGVIPHDDWFQPDWIDEEKATAARNEMVKNQVIYGGAFVCRNGVDESARAHALAL